MHQLIRVTNAKTGNFTYVAQKHILYFNAHIGEQPSDYAENLCAWMHLSYDVVLPVAEEVNYLLAKFPPL